MRRLTGFSLCCVIAVGLGACSPGDDLPGREAAASSQDAAAGAGPLHALPASAPALFGFGTPADEDRVAVWDRDVRPDGAGLPAGSGTVAQGAGVYQAKCIACHGPTATEGPNDPLVGGSWPEGAFPEGRRTIGSYWPHASTVFDYITRAMPQDRPGSLTADETYAVVAWILHQNGIIPEDAVLDAASLAVVVMPARDRFVPDDRRGGDEVR